MKSDPAFIEEQKRRLLEAKAELEGELKDLEGVPDMGSDVDSFEEEADEAEEYVTNLSKSDALQRDVTYINNALDRIKKGTYGVCTKCGKEISEEILVVAPESNMCKECKLAQPYRKTE